MIEVVFSSRVSLLVFYRLQSTLYGRVGNTLVEIYERQENLSLRSFREGPRELTDTLYGCEKVEKTFCFRA